MSLSTDFGTGSVFGGEDSEVELRSGMGLPYGANEEGDDKRSTSRRSFIGISTGSGKMSEEC